MARRTSVILLLAFFIISSSGMSGLIMPGSSMEGGAKNMCKTCIECVDTEGEEQKGCLMNCLKAGVSLILGPLCDKMCKDSEICNGLCGGCIPCAFESGEGAEKCLVKCVGEALIIGPICGEVCNNAAAEDWMQSQEKCQGACTECASCVFEEGGDAQKECALTCVVQNLLLNPLCANACYKSGGDPKEWEVKDSDTDEEKENKMNKAKEGAKAREDCESVCNLAVDCAPCVFQGSNEDKLVCGIGCVVGNVLCEKSCRAVCDEPKPEGEEGGGTPSQCMSRCMDVCGSCPACAQEKTDAGLKTCLVKECLGINLIQALCQNLFVGPMVQKCMECTSCALEPEENRAACLRDCVSNQDVAFDLCSEVSCDPICSGQRTEECRQRCGGSNTCTDVCIQDCKRECLDLCQLCGRCGFESSRESMHQCTIEYCIRPFMMTPICEDYCSESRQPGLYPENCMAVCMQCEEAIFSVDCVTRKSQVRPLILQCMFRDLCQRDCTENFEMPQEREPCIDKCDECKHCANRPMEEQEDCIKDCFNSLSVKEECIALCEEWGVKAGDATTRCHSLCAACVRCDGEVEETKKKECLRNCTMTQMGDYFGELCDSICQDQVDVATCRDKCMKCDSCPFEGGGQNITTCIISKCIDAVSVARPICEDVCENEPNKAQCIQGCTQCPTCVELDTRRKRLDCFTECIAPQQLGDKCDTLCVNLPNATGCKDRCRKCYLCMDKTGDARTECLERCADRGQRRSSCERYCDTAQDPIYCQSACMTCPQCDRLEGSELEICIQECTDIITGQMLVDICDDLCAAYNDPDRCIAACQDCTGCDVGAGQYECLQDCVDATDPGLDFSDKEKERRGKLKKGLLSGICDLLFGNIWDMFSCDLVCAMGGPCPIPDQRYLLKCPETAQENLYLYYTDLITYFENVAEFYLNIEKSLDAILMGTVGLCGMCNYQLGMIQGAYSTCTGIWNPTPYGAATIPWNEWMCDIGGWTNCQPTECTAVNEARCAAAACKCPQLCTFAQCHPIRGMACCPCSCPPCCCPTPLIITTVQASIDPVAMNACHSYLHEADDACTMDGLWWRKVVEAPALRNPCHVIIKITKLRAYVHALRAEIIPDIITQIRALRANARRCTVRVTCSSNIKIYLDLLEEIWDRANHIEGWDTEKFEDETNKFTLAMGDFMADIQSGGGGFSFDSGAGVWSNFKNGISVTASAYMDITAGGSFEKYLVWVPKYKNMMCEKPIGEATSAAGEGIGEIINQAKEKAKTAATDAVKSTFGVTQMQAMAEYHSKLLALHGMNKEAGISGMPGPTGCPGYPLWCIPTFPLAMHLVEGQNLGEDLVFNFPVLPKCGVQAFGKARPGDAFWHYHECLLYRSSTSDHGSVEEEEEPWEEEEEEEEEVWEEEEEVWGEEEEEIDEEEKIDCFGLADLTPCYDDRGICCDEVCVPGADECLSMEEECVDKMDGETCWDGDGLCCFETCIPNATACGSSSAECFGERERSLCINGLCCNQQCIPNALACAGATPDCIGKIDSMACADGEGICCREACIPGADSCAVVLGCEEGLDGVPCAGGTCCDGYCVQGSTSCGAYTAECGEAEDLALCEGIGLCCRGRCIPSATSCGGSAHPPVPDDIAATCGRDCEGIFGSAYYCHPTERVCACKTENGPRFIDEITCTPRVSQRTVRNLMQCCERHELDELDVCYTMRSETGFCCQGAFYEVPIDLSCLDDGPVMAIASIVWEADGREVLARVAGEEVNLTIVLRNTGKNLENGDLSFRVDAGEERLVEEDRTGITVDSNSVGRFTLTITPDRRLSGTTVEGRAIFGYLNTQLTSNDTKLYLIEDDTIDVSDGYFEQDGERIGTILPGESVTAMAAVTSSKDEPVAVIIDIVMTVNGAEIEGTRRTELVTLEPGRTATVGSMAHIIGPDDVGAELGILVKVLDNSGDVVQYKKLDSEVYDDAVRTVTSPFLHLKDVIWTDDDGGLLERVFEGKYVRAEVTVVNPLAMRFHGPVEVIVKDESDVKIVAGRMTLTLDKGHEAVIKLPSFTTDVAEMIALGEVETTVQKANKRYHVYVNATDAQLTWLDTEDTVFVLDSLVLEETAVVDISATSEFEGCNLRVTCTECNVGCEIKVQECRPVFNLCRCYQCSFSNE